MEYWLGAAALLLWVGLRWFARRGLFAKIMYVQVRENQFTVRNIECPPGEQQLGRANFSHPRLLVGDFTLAEKCLKDTVAAARGKGFALSTGIVIHPLEKTEGGLTQVEERIFQELGSSARVQPVIVWVGNVLSDDEVRAKLKGG